MTLEQANAVYDILVAHAGAQEVGRADFVFQQTSERWPTEYRFGGSLGFGGKFWRLPLPFRVGSDANWYVTAYPEDMDRRPEIRQEIDATNAALAVLVEG